MAAFTLAQQQDIQGFGIAGFRKDNQELLFIEFSDAAGGRRLLGLLEPRIASAWEVDTFNHLFSEVRDRTGNETLSATWTAVLISASGYRALGVATTGLPAGTGTDAFNSGMANRSAQIGDSGPDAPATWLGPFRSGVHACIIVAADEPDDLDEAVTAIGEQISGCGCTVVYQEHGATLPNPLTGREHFGFKDGISQPAIDGFDDAPAPQEPPAVPPGEFVLGFPNAQGVTLQPVGNLWGNGSFSVFRRLYQDVAAFRAMAAAGVPGSAPTLDPGQTAAALVGRWPSGASLEQNPAADPGEGDVSNAFQFKAAPFDDDDGHNCPAFSHIRKANPRDETTPDPNGDNPALHRMIRRGIPFGKPLAADAQDDGQHRGLHFFSVVADLDRQFEFVQRQWLNELNFPNGQQPAAPGPYNPPARGHPAGPDPVVGGHTAGEQCTLIQASGEHPFNISSQVVRVTAGEYFFVPSLSALKAVAAGATQ